MAQSFDPRGDLPVPIIRNTSYYSRPDSTFSKYDQRRSTAYGLAPASYPKRKPCYDWIFSSASNVHVAIERSAFKEYSSFKSYMLTVSDQRQVSVKGIGTVELRIRRQPGGKENHKVLLEGVLHVPGWLCNIISDVHFKPAKEYEHEWTDFGVSFKERRDGNLRAWGYTENFCGLDRLVLAKNQNGRSPMLEDKDREVFSVNLMWPQSQRQKWEMLIAEEERKDAQEHEEKLKRDAAKKEATEAKLREENAQKEAEAIGCAGAKSSSVQEEAECALLTIADLNKSLPSLPIAPSRAGDAEVKLKGIDPNVQKKARSSNLKTSGLILAKSKSAFKEVIPWRSKVEK